MEHNVASEFMDRLVQTAAFMDFAFDRFYKKYKVSRVQFLALFYVLEEENGIPLSKLGDKMSVSKANITTLVDRMESGGLVKRIPDESDRRIIRVAALDRGREIIELILPDRKEFITSIMDGLTEYEMSRANEILEKIRLGIQTEMKRFV